MIPGAKQTDSKAIRYLIGASILMLALMLFSEFSCSLLGLCKNWFPPAELVGFWEMMGISTAFLLAGLSIRSLRQPRNPEQDAENTESFVDDNASTPVDCVEPLAASPAKTSSRWRTLFNQLSEEEKQKLKGIIEKHCGEGDIRQQEETGPSPSS